MVIGALRHAQVEEHIGQRLPEAQQIRSEAVGEQHGGLQGAASREGADDDLDQLEARLGTDVLEVDGARPWRNPRVITVVEDGVSPPEAVTFLVTHSRYSVSTGKPEGPGTVEIPGLLLGSGGRI